jgi:3',5'-cyclic-nucleotide phosphodiesterase
MVIRLTVISGPDAGKRASFRGDRVTLGRGQQNDFCVRDGLVSQTHGELVVRDGDLYYRDLKSRHGTLVRMNEVTMNLHDRTDSQEAKVGREAHLVLGETLVHVETQATSRLDVSNATSIPPESTPSESNASSLGERVVKRATESLDAVTRRLINRDPRLVSIFKLSRSLNTVTDLHQILQLIAETTFEAFPAANFFAITIVPVDAPGNDVSELQPVLVRERGRGDQTASDGLLSQGLLRQVFESQQSMLFVRDASGIQPTESMINARITACIAAPLVGQRRLLGVMQADTRGMGGLFAPDDLDLFTVLASSTAFAIERVYLSQSIFEMFEGVVRMSVSAIDSRDPATAGHSTRVAEYTLRLARAVNEIGGGKLGDVTFSDTELTELRYAALLHDFGKVGVRETVLQKAGRLTPDRLEVVLERFQTARSAGRLDAYRVAFERGELEGWSPGHVREYAEQIAARRAAELDDAESILLEYQPGRPLPPHARAAMERIARQTFTAADGRVRQLLLAEELENMRIPSGTLNAREWEDMRSHAKKSYEFLCQIPWSPELRRVPQIAGMHHEKLDGSGYPDGLRADAIPHQVRIMTIADIFDALTAIDRPYRKAATVERTTDILRDEARLGLLDSELVQLFLERVMPAVAGEFGLRREV